MKKLKSLISYFSRAELALWAGSVGVIAVSFVLLDRENFLTLAASLIGVTALIFNAKGNPIGQVLMVFFSLIYGVISYSFCYYGEMLTYLGMSMPMAVFSLVVWLRHPYGGNRAEVAVGRLSGREQAFMWALTAVVTAIFYFILRAFDTANLIPSTISVTTSFAAVYLTARRSPFYAIAYAANDVVLIVLWTLATLSDVSYLSVTICFAAFLVNDVYGFVNWRRMEKRQRGAAGSAS